MKNMLNFKNFSGEELNDILALAQDMKKNPEKFKVFCPQPPFVREQWIRKIGNARPFKFVQRHDTDLVALYSEPEERYPEGTYELPY